VAVAGDVTAIIEIIKNTKLARELVLIRRDIRAIHGDGRVAVGFLDIAKNLIVGAILLDDVNDVANFVVTSGEGNVIGIALRGVCF